MKRLMVLGTFAILGCSQQSGLQLDAASAPVSCKSISINGADSEKICYREVNGLAIFQDDIVLGTVASLDARSTAR